MNDFFLKKGGAGGIISKALISLISIQMVMMPINAYAKNDWVEQSTIQNKFDNDRSISIDDIISSTGISVNDDIGSSIYNIPADQVAKMSTTQIGKGQVSVYGIYDITNAIGTISILNIRRNSDGSATLLQKVFTPYSLDSASSGGGLTAQQFGKISQLYGGNPFNEFKDSSNKNSFVSIRPEAFVTAIGMAMKHVGANYGMYAEMSTRVDVQTRKSGGKLRKKVTTTLTALIKPTWSLLVPTGTVAAGVADPVSGASFSTNAPIYGFKTATGKSINSGVQLVGMGDGTNLDSSETLIFKHSETKKSWTLIAIMVVAAVTGGVAAGLAAVAAGAASLSMGSVVGAGMMTGAAGSFATSWINGNTNLTAPVEHDIFFNVKGKAEINSFEMPSGAFNQWKVKSREYVLDGPMANKSGPVFSEFNNEKNNWDKRVPNGRNIKRAQSEDPFPNVIK